VSISYEATFPPTAEGVGAMRREVVAFADRAGLDEDGISDVRLAVSEAATNAVVHGYRDDREGELKVVAYLDGGELNVIVSDTGVGLAPRPDSPGLGLGMPLMATVTSRFRVISRGAGTEIHMAFALPDGAAPA
jgi:anti-sigma regulatory factor (Ser/Thr protein kinase)